MYDLRAAHSFSANHRDNLQNDKKCGCFYCCTVFTPDEINYWIDPDFGGKGTAVCPYCGIDSVIGESSGYPITKEFLQEMHDFWF